jgi:uncharacterized membrane protein
LSSRFDKIFPFYLRKENNMRLDKKVIILVIGLATIGLASLIYWSIPRISAALSTPKDRQAIGYPPETAKARVIEIIEEGVLQMYETPMPYQFLLIEILEGPNQDQKMNLNLGTNQFIPEDMHLRVGETILVMINQRVADGSTLVSFIDYERRGSLMWLLAAFVLVSILISGWKGVRSLIGILFSLAIIIFFIIPQILAGKDPVLVSILGSFVFLSVSMYLVYGWTLKTHSAVAGILIALFITGLLSAFFIGFTRLTGFGDENALFLVQQNTAQISLRGLLLAGMLIGALGVLDDLVISQASAVFELHSANTRLDLKFLYSRAMNIGRDHVASTVNTLVLAYAGASLPMLLLFSINSGDYALLSNMSMVAEEIVRTLVGSIGLFLSVPITTFLACLLALHHDRLGWVRPFLGPENQWDVHSAHFH